ncbi:MAG: hypothetical protein JSW03_08725 [Candidatus Eiseniibacteriota bacterium]|nr:MAG: hypothetical protein JSW03_08725 [Candidatus Eisenbacteria bacterium]
MCGLFPAESVRARWCKIGYALPLIFVRRFLLFFLLLFALFFLVGLLVFFLFRFLFFRLFFRLFLRLFRVVRLVFVVLIFLVVLFGLFVLVEFFGNFVFVVWLWRHRVYPPLLLAPILLIDHARVKGPLLLLAASAA